MANSGGRHSISSLLWGIYLLSSEIRCAERVYSLDWDKMVHKDAELVLLLMGFEYAPDFSSSQKKYFFRESPAGMFCVNLSKPLSNGIKNKLMQMYRDYTGETESG